MSWYNLKKTVHRISIDVPSGFHYTDMAVIDCSSLAERPMEIKGRGNTTWGESIITGGYLVQNGSQTDESSPSYFTTQRDEVWANHTPNFDTGAICVIISGVKVQKTDHG